VLTIANAAATNDLTCLPKLGGARDNKDFFKLIRTMYSRTNAVELMALKTTRSSIGRYLPRAVLAPSPSETEALDGRSMQHVSQTRHITPLAVKNLCVRRKRSKATFSSLLALFSLYLRLVLL
jgi:hypothetical protein